MSFVTDIADEIRKLPELAKGAVAFASSLAAVEGTLVTVAQATHIIPPLWLQAVAAGVSIVTGVAVVLTDLASSAPIVQKAIDVVEEVGKVASEVKSELPAAAPVPAPAPAAAPVSVVDQVITDFTK